MPRNGSGVYSLPAGNPVVTATTIQSTWANSTLTDVASALTDSVPRDGTGAMTGALRLADGSIAIPGLSWSSETTTGFSRPTTNAIVASVLAAEKLRINASGVSVSGALDVSGNITGTISSSSISITGGTINNTPIGATTANTGAFTTLSASSTVSGAGFSAYFASPPAIGATTPSTGAFTTLSASSTVSGAGFSTYLASPPAIGGTTAAAGTFTNLTYTGTFTGSTGVLNIGSGQVYKDASGNVGIGTASPTFGSGTGVEIERAGIATLRLENSSASNSFELYADTAANGINLRGRDSSPMLLWTANTERVRIASNGAIGIGGANYGTSGQVLTSGGSGAAPSWTSVGAPTVAAGTNYYLGTGVSETVTNNVSLERVLTTKMLVSGTVRVQWRIQSANGGSSRVYKNGVAQGTLRTTGFTLGVNYTEDISVSVGDNIEIYVYDSGGSGTTAYGINIGTSAYTTFAPHLGATTATYSFFTGV